MNGIMERFVRECTQAKTKEALVEQMRQAREALGFDSFVYGGLGLPEPNWTYPEIPPVIHVEYPAEWVNRYAERGYLHSDPVIRAAPMETGEIVWSDLRTCTKREQTIMGECREAGLCEGVTVPLHGPRGAMHMISYSGRQPVQPDPFVRSCLKLMAVHFHTRYQELCNPADPAEWRGALTYREREVLLWAARGKSAWATGQILNVSENTVRFHMKNVLQKLDAGSKIVAVVKAISFGLIDP